MQTGLTWRQESLWTILRTAIEGQLSLSEDVKHVLEEASRPQEQQKGPSSHAVDMSLHEHRGEGSQADAPAKEPASDSRQEQPAVGKAEPAGPHLDVAGTLTGEPKPLHIVLDRAVSQKASQQQANLKLHRRHIHDSILPHTTGQAKQCMGLSLNCS